MLITDPTNVDARVELITQSHCTVLNICKTLENNFQLQNQHVQLFHNGAKQDDSTPVITFAEGNVFMYKIAPGLRLDQRSSSELQIMIAPITSP